jgi:histidyl-tRNA synthetase
LIAYFEQHVDLLDADAQRRLKTNPLRILDTKNPAMQVLVQAAPQLLSFLGEASLKHLETVQCLLTACGVPWAVNPRLVRGLDYYSHTVFEFITTELGAQGTLCGGGRYDGLFEILGGKPTPAVGWGMGIERVLELLKEQAVEASNTSLDAYAIVPDLANATKVAPVLQQLRTLGITVQMHATSDGTAGAMKSQFKKADASGARYALVFGADELAKKQVTVKSLRDGQGAQTLQSLEIVESWAKELLS